MSLSNVQPVKQMVRRVLPHFLKVSVQQLRKFSSDKQIKPVQKISMVSSSVSVQARAVQPLQEVKVFNADKFRVNWDTFSESQLKKTIVGVDMPTDTVSQKSHVKPKVVPINSLSDIPKELLGTPVETLLRSNNFGETFKAFEQPVAAIKTCVDYRIDLKLPDHFAFVFRSPGVHFQDGFKLATVAGLKNLKGIIVIGHTDCAMRDLGKKEEAIKKALNYSGYHLKEPFSTKVSRYGIGEEVASTVRTSNSIRNELSKVPVYSLIYDSATGKLAYIAEPKVQG